MMYITRQITNPTYKRRKGMTRLIQYTVYM